MAVSSPGRNAQETLFTATWPPKRMVRSRVSRERVICWTLCPGRGAAFFMPLRRAGTVTNAGAWYGPGSAAHRFAKSYALRCVRGTDLSKLLHHGSPQAPDLGIPLD